MQASTDALIRDHLWIVERVKARLPRQSAADLRAAGLLGLVEAATRYDPERGRFVSWAWTFVRGQMLRELRRCHVVAVGEHTVRARAKTDDPVRGVVVRANVSDGFAVNFTSTAPGHRLFTPLTCDGGSPEERREQEGDADRAMRARALREAARWLPDPAHRKVIEATLDGKTPRQIAAWMKVGAERVRQLIKEATALLADRMDLGWMLADVDQEFR